MVCYDMVCYGVLITSMGLFGLIEGFSFIDMYLVDMGGKVSRVSVL